MIVSPFAPEYPAELPPVPGVRLAACEAGIRYRGRKDLMLVALIATFRGFHAERSSEGVSASTTSTVVTASVCILLADYVITSLWGV